MFVLLGGCLLGSSVCVASDFAFSEVAPGIFVHQGKIEQRAPGNMGDQANIGFIVGSKCVAVVDTGGSIKIGAQFRETIKQNTQMPVCYVINTHVHPDHMFGNAAFKDGKTVFVGHERLSRAMAARASNYSNSLVRDLGDGATGSEIVPPQQTVKDTLELDLGGRVIKLKAWPPGHTDNDVSVWDEQTKTLWLSDMLFLKHIPALDGSLVGWLAVIQQLKAIAAKRVIPGHGPVSAPWPEAIAAQERYLTKVLQGVRAALKDKKTIQEAVETVAWDEADNWQQFENFHRRTVTAAYAELEWEE